MLTFQQEITNQQLQEAIETRINQCFPAMNICNSLGGTQSTAWKLLRTFSPLQLFDEAKERGMNLESFVGNVDKTPITESDVYKAYLFIKAKGVINAKD